MRKFEEMFSLLERIDPQYREYRQKVNEGIDDGKIHINDFAKIINWDERFSSMEGSISIGNGEYIKFIGLQFYNEDLGWICEPRIFYRGNTNIMNFPIVATDNEMKNCVVINNINDLEKYGKGWYNNDFSMINKPLNSKYIENSKGLPYGEFEKQIYGIARNNKDIIYVNIYNGNTPKGAKVIYY